MTDPKVVAYDNYFTELADRMTARFNAMTPEEKEANERRIVENKKRDAEMRSDSLIHASESPARHLKAKDLVRSGEWGKTEATIKDRLNKGFLIAMTGIRGNGKTQLAVEIIRHNSGLGRTSRYCTAVEFFLEIKAGYKDGGKSEQVVINEFQEPGLLVIDEAGQRSESDWENRLLYELINRRYNDMRDTLIITNQESDKLEASLGPSIVSRMRETGGLIECTWESYRK